MKKIMLIGKVGCGKTSLNQALHAAELKYRKTQAVSYNDFVIDTPGEFTENRSFYSALLVTASQCDMVGMIQEAGAAYSIYPPGFALIFPCQTIGIVSKVDLGGDGRRARSFLGRAGVKTIIETSAVDGAGLIELRAMLE